MGKPKVRVYPTMSGWNWKIEQNGKVLDQGPKEGYSREAWAREAGKKSLLARIKRWWSGD